MKNKKKTTEQFKQEVYELTNGEYTVLGEYINNKTKIKIRHEKCGYEYEVKPNVFKNGSRCPKCIKRNKKSTEQFKQEVYDLVGDEYTVLGEYIASGKKIKMKHEKCGYEYEVTPDHFKRLGNRCPKCSGKSKKSTKEFKQEVYDLVGNEYTVLGEYINNNTKIKIKHNECNTEYEVTRGNFLKGHRCPKCFGNHKKSTEEFKQEVSDITKEEYSILSDYTNNKEKIKIKHNECGYEYEIRPNDFLNGHRCPKCSLNGTSKMEKELIDFVKSIYGINKLVFNDRKLLDGKEIDILINDTIGIEFNGLYWHSEKKKDDKKYHLNKTKLAEEKGIRLIQIFEDEWINKKDIVKSKILNILNLNSNLPKIYARKCIIKEIKNAKIKNNFLNKNHIQGEDKSNIKLGLYYEDKLVSIMTFVKPRISLGQKNTKYDYELSRFASDNDYHVIGAFSKLFKYFERNYSWNKIITYADKRWSQGNVYIKNGWIKTKESSPNYWYCKDHLRYHRFGFRKQILKEKFPNIYDSSLTEFEIMDKTNYFRVWDCGNIVFEFKRDS